MWNNFLQPLLYLNSADKYVLNVALSIFQQEFKAQWNLTLVGAMFNAIPVMTYYADVLVPSSTAARQVSQWSFAAQFDDFGRGVMSLSSIAFFVLLIVLGIYLSMVLIGKRHWLRHDASPVPMGRKVQALAGLLLAIPSLIALALAPVLVAESGTVALLIGILGTAAGLVSACCHEPWGIRPGSRRSAASPRPPIGEASVS